MTKITPELKSLRELESVMNENSRPTGEVLFSKILTHQRLTAIICSSTKNSNNGNLGAPNL